MSRRNGFTLVELLVVIAIIGILVALLLPAVQAAREAARRTQCKSQMRQMAIASLNHHDVVGHMPTSGWGWRWQPDASAGYGPDQPGGWTFNILPFIEEQSLRDAATPTGDRTEDEARMLRLVQSTVPVYNCPSRREPTLYEFSNGVKPTLAENLTTCRSGSCSVARTDYAGNGGNARVAGASINDQGPQSKSAAATFSSWIPKEQLNGVMYQRSVVRIAQITDGTSKTALLGEKYVSPDNYANGGSDGDDQNIFVGHDWDNLRFTGFPTGTNRVIKPQSDKAGLYLVNDGKPAFGAAHPGSMNMAFCDGSVQTITFDIDDAVFYFYGGRGDDGTPY
ncbi:putative major pilin subunit [Botrimarina colliarenosi]|uniref:Putative major pilin subunit n=1 Tax=Botrimarina colliarenosi TaxID=2528001 RepID=A0A5C6ADR3_9BACT|nr:DUF1559 domain-containing protein [Botrimarina colliarenosi]TWT97759.1 putative major pilin subunit [Botrimarina colliarenosi]